MNGVRSDGAEPDFFLGVHCRFLRFLLICFYYTLNRQI